jgi:hypothetical protein
MREELEPVGRFFASLRVPILQYKTCSTFDSAPHVGSIGVAVEVLRVALNPLVAISIRQQSRSLLHIRQPVCGRKQRWLGGTHRPPPDDARSPGSPMRSGPAPSPRRARARASRHRRHNV